MAKEEGGPNQEKLRPRGVVPRRVVVGGEVGEEEERLPVEILWDTGKFCHNWLRSKGSNQLSKNVVNILEGQTLQRWEGREGSTVGGPKAATSTSSSKNKPQQEQHHQEEKQQQAAESGAAQTTTQKQWGPIGVGPEGGGEGVFPWNFVRLCSRLFFSGCKQHQILLVIDFFGSPMGEINCKNCSWHFAKATGVPHDSPRAQTCTVGPLTSNNTKIHRSPRERKKSENGAGEEKGRKFGLSGGGRVPRRVPEGWCPEGWVPRSLGAPKGGGSEGWGLRRWEPKISRFFSLSRPKFRSFLPSLGFVSWNFGGVIEGRDHQMCTFGVLGLSCEAPFNHITKIPRNDPQRGKKRTNFAAGEGKKGEILGGPAEWGPAEGAPAEGGESGEGLRRRGVGGAPKFWTHPRKFWTHTAPTHHTTQYNNDTPNNTTGDPAQGGLGQGGSLTGRSMAQKTRHEQQIVPKSSPIGQGFLGQGWFVKVWRFDQKKGAKRRSGPKVVWAKSGAGQKLSKKRKKHGKTNQKIHIPLPFT